MVNYPIPSAGTKYVGKADVVRIKGADTINYVAMRNFRFSWGNEVIEEDVIGSDMPVQMTGRFRGRGRGELVVSTDLFTPGVAGALEGDIATLVSPDATTGDLAEIEIDWKEKDRQSPQKTATWVVKCRVVGVEKTWAGGEGFHHATIDLILTARPTVSVA